MSKFKMEYKGCQIKYSHTTIWEGGKTVCLNPLSSLDHTCCEYKNGKFVRRLDEGCTSLEDFKKILFYHLPFLKEESPCQK